MKVQKCWQVEVLIQGVKKRDRKVKDHWIPLCELPYEGFAPAISERILEGARATVRNNMRSWSRVRLLLGPVEHKNIDGCWFTICRLGEGFTVPVEMEAVP